MHDHLATLHYRDLSAPKHVTSVMEFRAGTAAQAVGQAYEYVKEFGRPGFRIEHKEVLWQDEPRFIPPAAQPKALMSTRKQKMLRIVRG